MSAADIFAAAVALCVVIMLHEGGHFLTALWSGMKVDRFSVFGIGPAIVKLGTWRGTEFVIGAIPFGAYVLIRGMEAEDEPPPEGTERDPESFNFRDKPLSRRALTIAGGPIANYITAIVCFFAVFTIFGVKQPPDAILIKSFGDDSAAQAAGAELGDQLVRVGEVDIDPTLGGRDVSPAATAHRGESIPLVVLRSDERVELSLDVPADEDAPPLSIQMEGRSERAPVALSTATVAAFEQPVALSVLQLQGLWKLITGNVSRKNVSGPIGIVEAFAEAATRGLPDFLEMTALISTLLGLFNLLPVPALDGGRLMFLAYEGVMKRRANPKVEEAVHGYGMLVLLALMALITVGDVQRLL